MKIRMPQCEFEWRFQLESQNHSEWLEVKGCFFFLVSKMSWENTIKLLVYKKKHLDIESLERDILLLTIITTIIALYL